MSPRETLPSPEFEGPVKLNPWACLNRRSKRQVCSACVDVCPTQALTLTGDINLPVWFEGERCQRCGACVAACPSGALTQRRQTDERRSLLEVLTRLQGRTVAIVCPRHPDPQVARSPAEAQLVLPRCLSVLTPSLLLQSVTALQQDLWLDDTPCADCPWAQTWGLLDQHVEIANRLLEAWGSALRVHLLGLEGNVQTPPHRLPCYSLREPGYSRREFVGALGQWALQAFRDALEEVTPGIMPDPRQTYLAPERHRLQEALQAWGPPLLKTISLEPGWPFGEVEVSSLCSGCSLCAQICPTQALRAVRQDDQYRLTFGPARCLGCGLCVWVCPEGALTLSPRMEVARWVPPTENVLIQGHQVPCAQCGAPVLVPEAESVAVTTAPLCYLCRWRQTSQGDASRASPNTHPPGREPLP